MKAFGTKSNNSTSFGGKFGGGFGFGSKNQNPADYINKTLEDQGFKKAV
jgi:hypothetical protein